MTGYPGHPILIWQNYLLKTQKPLVADIFMSLYVIVHERKLEKAKFSAAVLDLWKSILIKADPADP